MVQDDKFIGHADALGFGVEVVDHDFFGAVEYLAFNEAKPPADRIEAFRFQAEYDVETALGIELRHDWRNRLDTFDFQNQVCNLDRHYRAVQSEEDPMRRAVGT